jgi:hypothetical protein
VRSLSEALGTLTFAVFAGVFVACAPTQTASTTTTAADLPSPSRSDAPSTREAADADGPEGQLACKSRSMAEGKAELYLDWNGSSARGTLRREAPSGMVSVQNIRAERYKGMVIADDTLSTDLVVHAATLREHNGKKYIRLGDYKQAWLACE